VIDEFPGPLTLYMHPQPFKTPRMLVGGKPTGLICETPARGWRTADTVSVPTDAVRMPSMNR